MDKYDILGYIAIIFILGVCVYIYKYNNITEESSEKIKNKLNTIVK